MNRIHLIRHGQAAADILDYDDLSPLGERQVATLGAFYRDLLHNGTVYAGSMNRHRKSARAFIEGSGYPDDPIEDPRLNEFDFLDIVRQYVPAWRNPEQLRTDLAEQSSPDRYFLRVFREALLHWFDHPDGGPYIESWYAFKERTRAVLNDLNPEHSHWLFTSGGVISSLVADALDLEPAQMIRLNLNLANASVTTFQAVKGRWRLMSINQMQHLHDKPDLITFR